MVKNTTTSIAFAPRFLECIRRAAELRGVVFSEFVRLAAKELAERTFRERGLDIPADMSAWHMTPGGDFSEARAAKGGNYRKRSLPDKIDEAKTKAQARRKAKGNESYAA